MPEDPAKSAFRRAFTNGFCCAVGVLIRQHGCGREAIDLFRSAGTAENIRKYADPYDVELFEEHNLFEKGDERPSCRLR